MVYSSFFLPIVTLLTAQITVLDLAKFRFKTKKMLVIVGLELLIQVAVNGALLFFFGLERYADLYIFTMDIPAFAIFYYCSKRRDLRDLFTVLITIFLSFVISIPSLWICNLLKDKHWWRYNLFRILIFIIVFFLLHRFVRKRYIRLQDEIEKGWGMFSILPMIGSGILYYEYIKFSSNGDFTEVFWVCSLTVVVMATAFAVFNYVFNQLHEKFIVQEQRRILFMQNKAQREQYEHQKEEAEKTNRRWHDLRHGISQLIELIEEGKTETAIAYLKEQQGMDIIPKEEYCLHPAVNSILCYWAERSRRAGIAIDIHADVPEQLDIEPMELSSLFANAFENAYEGCLCLPQKVPKYIKVNTNYNDNRLAVGFTNSCRDGIPFMNGMPVSSKQGGGIGTQSIAYTVQRFHGTKYFEAREGIFTARFVLNL